MFRSSVAFLALVGLSAVIGQTSGDGSRTRRSARYQGPPAPLNKDGTVALTPEVQHARISHDAAIAAEFKRFEEAKRLAAAHPDLTSPPDGEGSKDYTSQIHNQGKGYNAGIHGQGPSYDNGQYSTSGHVHNLKIHMPAPLNKDGTVALTPEVQHAKAAHDAAINAELKRLMEAQALAKAHPDMTYPSQHRWNVHQGFTSHLYNQGKEYNSGRYIANSGYLSHVSLHFEGQYSVSGHNNKGLDYNSMTPMPAPLNKDGTVALTPEVQQAKARHDEAINAELIRLMEAQALAKAHPDMTSPSQHGWNVHQGITSRLYNQGKEYNTARYTANKSYYGHYSLHFEGQYSVSGHYSKGLDYNPKSLIPAPLNKDGTVALTPEVQQANAAHDAAIVAELKRLMEAQNLAEAHPDLTSPPNHKDYSSQMYNQGQYIKGYEHNPKIHMPAPLNKGGTVGLTPEVQQAKAAHEAAFNAELMKLMEAQALAKAHPDMTSPKEHAEVHYMQGLYSDQGVSHPQVHSQNPEAQVPAPLNPDGTVAQTAAYKAIASSHNAEYEKVLHKVNQHKIDHHFQNQAAEGYSY